MKQLIRRVFRGLGFEFEGWRPVRAARSVRTDALSCVDTATSRYYLPRDARADVIARAIRAGEIFDKEIVDIARAHIKPGSAVLDVGANFGQMSVLFSNWVGEQGKVYSFDADDFVFGILKKNTAPRERASRWAALLRRVFALDVFACPRCGGRRRLVGVYTGAAPLDLARAAGPRPELLRRPGPRGGTPSGRDDGRLLQAAPPEPERAAVERAAAGRVS